MSAQVTITFAVPPGHLPGDYAKLFGNSGAGDIDYNTPLNNNIYELFPQGAGIYGYGHAPFGHFRYGKGHAMRTAGYGHLPFGHFPFGIGTTIIEATDIVDACGTYKYAFVCYDAAGNEDAGTPEEAEIEIHLAPPAPLFGLEKNSYNKTTDVLVLDVAD